MLKQLLMIWVQLPSGSVREGRAITFGSPSATSLHLPVKHQVIGILGELQPGNGAPVVIPA